MCRSIPFCLVLLVSATAANRPVAGGEAAALPDEHTVVLLHLDGNGQDASRQENHAEVKGEARWSEGRGGQALRLDGQGGLVIAGNASTAINDSDWLVECWVQPAKAQPAQSVLVSGGWGHGRLWSLRISGTRLTASFSAGPYSATVLSGDVSDRLFDGGWHRVAAVLDRRRGGEVRLYLDGQRVDRGEPACCPPIWFQEDRMGLAVGAAAPWYIGRDGYFGLLDELRVSRQIPPEYSADPSALPRGSTPWADWPAPDVDLSGSDQPLPLKPVATLLVLPAWQAESAEFAAAAELQRWLRAGSNSAEGFSIVRETDLHERRTGYAGAEPEGGKATDWTILALGRTAWLDPAELAELSPAGYLLQRRGRVVVIAGATASGTYHGAMQFLDQILGVRFYLPTDLFTSTPAAEPQVPVGWRQRQDPFVQSGLMSGIAAIPGDDGWAGRNATQRRLGGSHQHTMYAMFDPRRYAPTHPEIYPIRDGQRYIPAEPGDQRWQPCLSAATLVDVAEDAAVRYFRLQPQATFVAFSVQDGHTLCQCPACLAAYGPHKTSGDAADAWQAKGFSELYYRFIEALGRRLQQRLPGKQLVALVYGPARFPPAQKMPDNVVLFTNFHIAELDADRILAADPASGRTPLDQVLDRCNAYGNHDWYHGHGFLMPRIYSGYWSRFLQHLASRVPTAQMHVEAYPNWGLDGPKLYLLGRLWWDPQADVDRLLRQFCSDMFGPAAEPMHEYFQQLEQLWVTLDNVKGPERKLFQWNRQFAIDADDLRVVARCRALLDDAARQAATPEQRRRIALFSDTFRVPQTLWEFAAADSITQAHIDGFWEHVQQRILPDPLTLYGAGADSAALRKELAAALDWSTGNGRRIGGR